MNLRNSYQLCLLLLFNTAAWAGETGSSSDLNQCKAAFHLSTFRNQFPISVEALRRWEVALPTNWRPSFLRLFLSEWDTRAVKDLHLEGAGVASSRVIEIAQRLQMHWAQWEFFRKGHWTLRNILVTNRHNKARESYRQFLKVLIANDLMTANSEVISQKLEWDLAVVETLLGIRAELAKLIDSLSNKKLKLLGQKLYLEGKVWPGPQEDLHRALLDLLP